MTGPAGSNLTNKYNPQERLGAFTPSHWCSNLTNKYNPQELYAEYPSLVISSNLTNKYNPQEHSARQQDAIVVQILPINTILKNWMIEKF